MQTGARSARQTVRDAAERLARAGVPEPIASAEVLLAELLGVRRGELVLREKPLTDEEEALYEAWISRREKREPVQRILGYAYFRNLRLELDEHTLIPRPDTESVVDSALEVIDRQGTFGPARLWESISSGVGRRESGVEKKHYPLLPIPYYLERSEAKRLSVLDLGTGSGAIAIAIAQERPSCDVYATDHSEGALRIARRNAVRAGVAVRFYKADLASGLDSLAGSIDVFVSNPPYIKSTDIPELAPEVRDWDPHAALDGGPDGLDFYRRIFTEAAPILADGADVVLEVGDGQAEAVLELGRCAGYDPLRMQPALTGKPRMVLLRWSSD